MQLLMDAYNAYGVSALNVMRKVEIITKEELPAAEGMLANGIEQATVFELLPKKALQKAITTNMLFDKVHYVTQIRGSVSSLLDKSYGMAQASACVLYSLLALSLQIVYCKKQQKTHQVAVVSRLVSEYSTAKKQAYNLEKHCLKTMLDSYNIHTISQNRSLALKLLLTLARMGEFQSWNNKSWLYKDAKETHAMLENYEDYHHFTLDYFKIHSILSSSLLPKDNWYAETSLALMNFEESIKVGFIPTYDTAVLTELLDDAVLFGQFFKHHRMFLNQQTKNQIDGLQTSFDAMIAIIQTVIDKWTPSTENSSHTSVTPALFVNMVKAWYQLVPDEAMLLSGNKNLSIIQKCFCLFFYAAHQVGYHIFTQSRYFFEPKILLAELSLTSHFSDLDFAHIFSSSYQDCGALSVQENQLIFNNLKTHVAYLLRLISFFRMRKTIIQRYIKVNCAVIEQTSESGIQGFINTTLKDISETQIKSFKKTIIGPQHYIHKKLEYHSFSLANEDKTLNKNSPTIFSVNRNEQNSFFAADYAVFNLKYQYENGFKIDRVIKQVENTNDPTQKINVKRQLSDFSLDSFMNINKTAYFDFKNGLFQFDFNPFENIEQYQTLKPAIQEFSFEMISKFLKQQAGIVKQSLDMAKTAAIPQKEPDVMQSQRATGLLTPLESVSKPLDNINTLSKQNNNSFPQQFPIKPKFSYHQPSTSISSSFLNYSLNTEDILSTDVGMPETNDINTHLAGTAINNTLDFNNTTIDHNLGPNFSTYLGGNTYTNIYNNTATNTELPDVYPFAQPMPYGYTTGLMGLGGALASGLNNINFSGNAYAVGNNSNSPFNRANFQQY